MELLEGETLKHHVAGKRMKIDQLLELAYQIAEPWMPPTRRASFIATSSRPTSS
jgi:hypothetical protein